MLQRQFASYEMRKKVLLLKIQLVSPVDGEAGTKASIFDALANCSRYNRGITMQYSLGVHQLAYCPQHVSCSYTRLGLASTREVCYLQHVQHVHVPSF